MTDTNSFLHLARPLGPATIGNQPSTAPLSVIIQPQTIFSILDHSIRRHVGQERTIGTLLGSRSEDGTEVEIRNCFAVGHNESQDQVEVDMEYQKSMLSLYLKANPKEVLVGWYATSPNLDAFSALIQNFYGGQGDGTFPHQAVHLTISTEPGKEIELRTYISAPVGVTSERAMDSCLFIPVPYELRYGDTEKAGLELLSAAKNQETRSGAVVTDIESLERAIVEVLGMLERVSEYVSSVLDEETRPSSALGQYLLNALALAPKVDHSVTEKNFNNHIQDVLVISYLANNIRTQIELSNRLATASLVTGPGDGLGGGGGGERTEGGGRGGRNQRGGRGRESQQRNTDQ